ncbi:MAG: hypothetical protein B6D61_08810 [Bacteroidetes bacterium 4484_249]|nr:MAG: hypothetical protein B6D61_08810 [Bacteroidetes bacterium 4484_249]
MLRMQIVADNKIPFLKGILEPYADIVYLSGEQINRKSLSNADALIIRSVTKCNANILKGTNIKFIATATTGDDHIDKNYCQKNNIEWHSASGCNASAVEQYVTAALLGIAQKSNIILKNLTIGIIGVGNIGSRIEKIAKILGMNVLLNDPPRAEIEGGSMFTDINTLLGKSDIITLHVPLTSGGKYPTYHLADEGFFSKMQKPAILINTSRGEVVDTGALKRAISKGIVNSPVIDVWENEPEIDRDLLDQTAIATFHIAGYSLEGKAKATAMVVETVSRYFNFGIKLWYPDLGKNKIIKELDCTGTTEQEILYKAINFTYNIFSDDKKLHLTPDKFAGLRNNYNFRREFGAFKLKLTNCKKNVFEKLERMGFQLYSSDHCS